MPKTRLFRLGLVALAAFAVSPLTACIVDVGAPGYTGRPPVTNKPVINAFSANPTAIADKDSQITFTVNATDPAGLPLQYTWASTRGTLSATTGQTVFWRPLKADGSLEAPGLATVTVLVSNGRNTESGALNLMIKDNGATEAVAAGTTPPSASPSAAPTASPTAAPTASPSPAASPSPSASPAASPAPSESPSASPEASPSPSPSASAAADVE